MSDALINGLAGAGGGIVAQLITYPLLTVNTRQQTERDPSRSAVGDGAVRQMLEVVKQEGWGPLYGGLAPSLVGTAASQMIVSRDLMRNFVLIFDPDGDLPGSHTSYKILNCHPKNAITGRSGSIVASCDSISLTQYNSLLFSLFSSALSFYPVIYIIECHSLFFEFEHWLFAKKMTISLYGVYYYFYQIFRDRAERSAQDRWRKGIGDGSVGMFQSLVVAALAGCVNVLLTNPIWVVVTRMQTHKKTSNGPPIHALSCLREEAVNLAVVEHQPCRTSHVVQELYNEAGFWGFWKGVVPTLIMVSNPSIQFMLYETLLKKIKRRRSLNTKGAEGFTAHEIFLLGAVAKLGATIVTYPMLVVKARLQVKQGLHDDKRRQYTGTYDAITKMIRYEGLSGLYKGMGTKIVQSVFAAAVLFTVKEELVKAARVLVTGELRRINNSRMKTPS
ncbi:unnamed protein product [Musa hybrid cultivar]